MQTYRSRFDERLTSRLVKARRPLPFASYGAGTLRSRSEVSMNLHLTIAPVVSVLAGILILVVPRLLNYIVAIYLIIIGLLGLFGSGSFHLS